MARSCAADGTSTPQYSNKLSQLWQLMRSADDYGSWVAQCRVLLYLTAKCIWVCTCPWYSDALSASPVSGPFPLSVQVPIGTARPLWPLRPRQIPLLQSRPSPFVSLHLQRQTKCQVGQDCTK